MLNFTPLLGAQSDSAASQSLLELDGGVKILVDAGWDESFDVEKLRGLERQVPTISIILLTHATSAHIGAFAHCCKHIPLFSRIPVYATIPVISLGRTLLQDIYASTPLASTLIPLSSLSEASYSYSLSGITGESSNILLQPPTPEEIADCFSRIHPLKYSQPHQPLPSPFSPPLNGLTITAYNAGHTLGGTIWHIQHGLESIVYAVDWNQLRENVLAGAAWLGGAGADGSEVIEQLRKPTALICSSKGAERLALPGGRKKRDELLLEMVREAVAKGGTVLIPTDTSARVLELAYLLEHAWRNDCSDNASTSPLKDARLYLASMNVGATMRYARSMLEWMDEGIVREFEAEGTRNPAQSAQNHKRTVSHQLGGRGAADSDRRGGQTSKGASGPFEFKHLKLLERKTQVNRILGNTGGQVILASDSSLEWGFSREVLRQIASKPENLIILTERFPSTKSFEEDHAKSTGLGNMLWDWWESTGGGDDTAISGLDAQPKEVRIENADREPLQGTELMAYQQYLATQRQLQNTMQPNQATALETSADAVDDASSSSSSSTEDEDDEQQGRALNISATLAHSNRKQLGSSTEDIGVNILLRGKNTYDYDVRGKKGREKMFPYVAKRRRGDDFGDLIRPEEYLRAEERDDVDGHDMRESGGRRESTLGQKRKWDDIGLEAGAKGRRMSNGANKRRQTGRNFNRTNPQGSNGVDHAETNGSINNADESEESDYEPDEPTIEGPSKVIFSTATLHLNLRIAFVDFSGLHDKRFLEMLIPQIQPRKLILVAGMKNETLSFADTCRELLAAKSASAEGSTISVFTPAVGESVDASVDTNAWIVKLSESLMKRLHWQNVRGLGVVTVTGQLGATASHEDRTEMHEGAKKKQKLVKGENELSELPMPSAQAPKLAPTLDVIPASMAAATRSVSQPLHVGDLRLADLRKILATAGHHAEFRGEGILLIDGIVAVRKTGTGRIEVESSVSMPGSRSSRLESTFYAVKRKIYEGLAIVAGG
ncbi:MAG: hypothetical protein M1812_001052 [Candelaria pacifica]|nr:MAG: hypothetical protein M1812_001052 [Candelaria pacifica]